MEINCIYLGVIASRTFNNYKLLKSTIKDWCNENNSYIKIIICNNTKDTNILASKYASDNNLVKTIYPKDYNNNNNSGKSIGIIDNKSIIKNSDYIIAFWDGNSKGTLNCINKAKSMNKPIKVIQF